MRAPRILAVVPAIALSLTALPAALAQAAPPAEIAVSSGVGKVTVFWSTTAPAAGFIVKCTPAGAATPVQKEVGSTARSTTFTGLTGGVSYTCGVSAKASGTTSPFVNAGPVTVFGLPGAPTLSSVRPGDSSLVVTFAPSASTGGTPVLDYRVSCGTATVVATASPAIVPLPGSTGAVACTVRARNAVGLSAASIPLTSTPGQRPATPKVTKVDVAAPGSLRVEVSSTASTLVPITKVSVACWPVAGGQPVSASAASSPVTVTGVVSGEYTCAAAVDNAYGTSAPSTPSAPVTAIGTLTSPAAPAITWKRHADGAMATITFSRSLQATEYVLDCKGPAALTRYFPISQGTIVVPPGAWSCSALVKVKSFTSPASPVTAVTITPDSPKVGSPSAGKINVTRPGGLKEWTASCTLSGGKTFTKNSTTTTATFTDLKAGKYACKARGNGVTSEETNVTVK